MQPLTQACSCRLGTATYDVSAESGEDENALALRSGPATEGSAVWVSRFLKKVLQKPKMCDGIAEKVTRSDQACGKGLVGKKTGKIGVEKLM